jgi:hypothetical protein
MLMAQRYPSYFDGIVSGAPAMRTGHSNLALRFMATTYNQIAPRDENGKPVTAQALSDSRSLRRAALLHKVPYYTTLAGALAAAEGIRAYRAGDLEVRALQEYFA